MKYIKITKQDIVENMTDEQKHNLAVACQLNCIIGGVYEIT